MLILHEDAVVFDGTKTLYGGNLFHGVVISFDAHSVVAVIKYDLGVQTGEWLLPFPIYPSSIQRISLSMLRGDGLMDFITMDGEPFYGIAFEVDPVTRICSRIIQVEHGSICSEIQYSDTALIKYDHSSHRMRFGQRYQWGTDGGVEKVQVGGADPKPHRFEYMNNRNLQMSFIQLQGDYFELVAENDEMMPFNPVMALGDIEQLHLLPHVTLSRSDYNISSLLQAVAGHKQGKQVRTLEFCSQPFTIDILPLIGRFEGLEVLKLDIISSCLSLDEIKEELPHVQLIVNRYPIFRTALVVDVYYTETTAHAAGIVFSGCEDIERISSSVCECSLVDGQEYVSGEFYKRELPILLKLIESLKALPDVIIIDGYVYLDEQKTPGLGCRLYEALGKKVPIIGVAKNPRAGIPSDWTVRRGGSKKYLYLTSVGVPMDAVKLYIREMEGEHRIPSVLKEVDQLSRSNLKKAVSLTGKR